MNISIFAVCICGLLNGPRIGTETAGLPLIIIQNQGILSTCASISASTSAKCGPELSVTPVGRCL